MSYNEFMGWMMDKTLESSTVDEEGSEEESDEEEA